MEFKDHFSTQAEEYTRFRPHYPDSLFRYLSSQSSSHQRAWDCATGNGQAAKGLVRYFDEVIATDASESQIRRATSCPNVSYHVCTAEDSGIKASSVDLITVAQAIHWFDFDAFFREAVRVSKTTGVIAFWGYGLLRIDGPIDALIRTFYGQTLAGHWPDERRHIDAAYETIPFPFRALEPPEFEMTCYWNLNHLLGYLKTWSAVQRYKKATGEGPVDDLAPALAECWSDWEDMKKVKWPVFLRVAKIENKRF